MTMRALPRVPCKTDGCDAIATRPRIGFCESHYRRDYNLRNGRGVRHDYRLRDEHGRKRCPGCREWLALESFSVHPCRDDELSRECTTCHFATNRRGHLKRRYGLTVAEYDALVEAQDGRCAICLDPLTDTPAVDHDHACCGSAKACSKCVRGLLCLMCNSGIGYLRDSAEIVGRAHEYLARVG